MSNGIGIDYRETFWRDIPVGKENSITYDALRVLWGMNNRAVRLLLRELSCYDNGDDYILIRSGGNKGFYKTDDPQEIIKYKRECINKGRALFAPVKKINRVLNSSAGGQLNLINNLRFCRESLKLKQREVCEQVSKTIPFFDTTLLSRMENSLCLPTPQQLDILAKIYGCDASDLINIEDVAESKETA